MKIFKSLLFLFYMMLFISIGEAAEYLSIDEGLRQELRAQNIQLYVMRNGEAISNIDDLTSSSRSPQFHLTKSGRETVKANAKELLVLGVDAIYTSPIYRALNTTEIIANTLKLPYTKTFVEEALRQQNFGVFEGGTYQQYKSYFPSSRVLYSKGAPGGETGKSIYDRTRNLLWKIAASQDKQVLIVTHAFNIAYINRLLTGEFGDFPKLGDYQVYDFTKP